VFVFAITDEADVLSKYPNAVFIDDRQHVNLPMTE